MPKQFIQLKQARDIGETIGIFFDFFKQNIKAFLNIFIRYNGIFIIAFLGLSYLMVTGFVGTMQSTNTLVDTGADNSMNEFMVGLGAIGFMLLFLVTGLLNYSLAASYVTQYQTNGDGTVQKESVWKMTIDNVGKTILFIFLMILIYIGVLVVGVIVSIIPILGTFAYYIIMLAFQSWMGLSFMSMFYEKKEVTAAFGEGWNLLFKYFWHSVLVNLVVSLLLSILMLLVLMIPGVLIGIYVWHAAETGVDLSDGALPKIIWTIGLSILLIVFTLNQSVSQFINGVLYFSLHEKTYNQTTRENIDQIGLRE